MPTETKICRRKKSRFLYVAGMGERFRNPFSALLKRLYDEREASVGAGPNDRKAVILSEV